MHKTFVSITFNVTLAGNLWWEGLATIQMSVTFSPILSYHRKWTGLQDALDYIIIPTGDFCDTPSIVSCDLTITWWAGKDTIIRHTALPVGKLTAPYMADNETMEICLEG